MEKEPERSIDDDKTAQDRGAKAVPDRPAGRSEESTAERYEILGLRGEGGMGKVYRARDRKLNIEVALKRLSTDLKESELGVKRFLNEAQTIAQLNHRNIVQVKDLGEDSEGHYIVMEWIEGSDLGELIQEKGKLDLDAALELFRSICNGVSYAHRHSVIHRDIKPQNILVSQDGTPKIVDFGLARMGRESDYSVSGMGMGTAAYVAPEQRRDAKRADHRSDIFSLGKTFYYMITGEDPHVVDHEAIPLQVRAPILKALKSRAEDRHFSVEEMLLELETAVAIEPKRARPPTSGHLTSAHICECGHEHGPEDRYCQHCGHALFELCPADDCDGDMRIGGTHCRSCGLEIARYDEYLEHKELAKSCLSNGRRSEAANLAEKMRVIRPGDAVAKEVLAEVERITAKLDELRKKCQRMIDGGQLDEGQAAAKEMLNLDPADSEALALLELISDRRVVEKIASLRSEMKRLLKTGRIAEAAVVADRILLLDGSDKVAARALSQIEEEKRARVRAATANTLVSRAAAELEQGHASMAADLATQALGMNPKNSQAREVLASAERAGKVRFYEVIWGLVGAVLTVLLVVFLFGK